MRTSLSKARRAAALPRGSARLAAALAVAAALVACAKAGPPKPKPRERAPERDASCAEPARPKAYFYPAENRTDYGPDDPWKDGCAMLVPDHLFCCPEPGVKGGGP